MCGMIPVTAPINFTVDTRETVVDKTLSILSGYFLYWYRPTESIRIRVDGTINTPAFLFQQNICLKFTYYINSHTTSEKLTTLVIRGHRGTSLTSRGRYCGSTPRVYRGRGRGAFHSSRGEARRGRTSTRGGPIRNYGKSIDADLKLSSFNPVVDITIDADPKIYFVNPGVTLDQHIQAQTANISRYLATMLALDQNGVQISQKAKACVLAAAWCRHDKTLASSLLKYRSLIGLTEILKAVTMLDAARQIRVYEKKLKRLQSTKTKTKAIILGKIKNNIDNLEKLKPSNGSFTNTVAKQIRYWTRMLSQQELEYYALHMPTEPWRKLADIVHFNPAKDFPSLPWFLPFCFGQAAPSESMVAHCRTLTSRNVNTLLKEFKIPYSHLKQFKDYLDDESKARIAVNEEKLDTILWYYEDLACLQVDDVIQERLRNGEQITLPYGKLMERLLLFRLLREPDVDCSDDGTGVDKIDVDVSLSDPSKLSEAAKFYSDLLPLAESQLQKFKLQLESPVAVLADASFSMEVAIRTATILSSLLTAICSASLTFFHNVPFRPAFVPKSIEDVIVLALVTEVGPCTANAIGLVPYYEAKEVVKTFIMVTDEEENTSIQMRDGTEIRFFELFMKYRAEIYPAKLVFISFLAHQHDQGQIYSQFVAANVPDVLQFKFNRDRPDLTKLDNLLGLLSTNSADSFNNNLEFLQVEFERDGLAHVVTRLIDNQQQQSMPIGVVMSTTSTMAP